MLFLPMVPLFVLLAFIARGHRDSESSGATGQLSVSAASEAHATVSAAASAEAKAEVELEFHTSKSRPDVIEECRKAQEAREGGKETNENVKILSDCIYRLKQMARSTELERQKSEQANKEYAEDMIEARTIMSYLNKKMSSRDEQFQRYRNDEKKRETELMELMHRITSNPQTSSMLQSQQAGSDYAMLQAQLQAQQASMLQAQQTFVPQVMPASMQNVAAMFTPSGQSFGVQPVRPGLAGQPSLLQLGVPPAWNRGVGTGASDLQAKLDKEAARMEESDAAEDGMF